jgi:pimeloyl-ACP methyl ester carboxylesterase
VTVHGWKLTNTYPSSLGEVRWATLGDASAPPLVLLHGTPFSSYIWRHIARAFSHHFRVHVWDMPGYGTSEMSDGQDLSLDALAALFAELLGHWGLDEPLVVAHDSGGAVALGAHLRHHARYRRLALVDAVSLAPWGSPFFQLVGANTELFGALPARLHDALLREYVNTASSPSLHPATLEALVAPWLGDAGHTAFYRQLAQRTDDEAFVGALQDRYAEIDLPVAVLWGEDDTWIPIERGRELASRVPTATFQPVPGAGHLVQEDNPAELTAALLTFLQR